VSGGPRVAIFTHDTFGLGHVRRCLHVVHALAERAPDAAILFVTGSPALHALGSLPPNADFVKIPTIAKTGEKRLRPPHLPLPLDDVSSLRAALIREAVLSFAPDVLLVDNFPLGSRGELLPTLESLDRRRTRTVLGLRDILDAPETVRADWTRQGIYEVLRCHYDRILIYGVRDVLDVEQAYALPADVALKVHYCGYVTGNGGGNAPAEEVRRELGFDAPFLLATGGGGGDGFPLLSTVLDALPLIPRMPAMVLTGPLMSEAQRAQLRKKLNGHPQVQVREFVPDLRRYMGAAGVVVAMCGYNTAAEIMALRPRAVVVPRTWRYGEHLSRETAGAEWEQMMRARSLAELGLAQVLDPRSLTPGALAERIRAALDGRGEPRRRPEVDLMGLDRVTGHILALARAGERTDAEA
jgi:predicted glycosyltransferase